MQPVTKPLWYGIEGGKIAVASYESAVKSLGIKAVKLEANTILTLDLDTKSYINSMRTYEFILHQFSESFDGWIGAFKESIRKRTKGIREKVFIGLSSGYDSGGIACELNNQYIPYKAYTVVGNEDRDVLRKRYQMFNENSCGVNLQVNRWAYKDYINKNVEEFKYL